VSDEDLSDEDLSDEDFLLDEDLVAVAAVSDAAAVSVAVSVFGVIVIVHPVKKAAVSIDINRGNFFMISSPQSL